MTVAMLIEQLQKLEPNLLAVWYDSECSQFFEVNAITTVVIGIRHCGESPDIYPVWENHFENDTRQGEIFTAVEVNTYIEQH